MELYFCETCGKRLSDGDVDSGRAKNKKLKGVYCSTCAVGVMTVETLPVAADPAPKLPVKLASPPPKAPKETRRVDASHRPLPSTQPTNAQGKSIIAAAAVLLLMGAILLLANKGNAVPRNTAKDRTTGKDDTYAELEPAPAGPRTDLNQPKPEAQRTAPSPATSPSSGTPSKEVPIQKPPNAATAEAGQLFKDARVARLFSGKVLKYEPESMEVDIEYDFSDEKQELDFEGSHWNSDKLKRNNGEVQIRNNANLSLPLRIPFISSDHFELTITYSDLNRDLFILGLFPKMPKEGVRPDKDVVGIALQKTEAGLYRIGNVNKALVETYHAQPLLPGVVPASGRISFKCSAGMSEVLANNQSVMKQANTVSTAQAGICFGGGAGSSIKITSLRIAGKVAQEWLETKLGK